MASDLRLLCVEDEIIIALDTAQTLAEIGFDDVHIAHSLRQAEQLCRDGGHFDIALLDVNLGGGDTSFDLGRRLMARGVRVVFSTGYNLTDMIAEHPDLTFIEKPLIPSALRQALIGAP